MREHAVRLLCSTAVSVSLGLCDAVCTTHKEECNAAGKQWRPRHMLTKDLCWGAPVASMVSSSPLPCILVGLMGLAGGHPAPSPARPPHPACTCTLMPPPTHMHTRMRPCLQLYDRITVKQETPLLKTNRAFRNVSTSEDPIMKCGLGGGEDDCVDSFCVRVNRGGG